MAFKTDQPNEDLFAGLNRDVRRNITVLVDDIAVKVEALKEAEALADEAKAKLKQAAKDAYWEINFGGEPVHVFDANGRTNVLQINFPNRYILETKDTPEKKGETAMEKVQRLVQLLGADCPLLQYFTQKTICNVDVTELDKPQMVEFFKEMSAVCKKYGLQGYVDDKVELDPEFHNARHELMPQINKAIDAIMPVQVHITT